MFSGTDGIAGVLTDGLKFDFFFLRRGKVEPENENPEQGEVEFFELYKAPVLYASDKQNINLIMGKAYTMLH
jgi:hypothetical protein